jgi:hypothetical protein
MSAAKKYLQPTANVPRKTILDTMMMEAIPFSETSVLTRATQHHNPKDGILHLKDCLHHLPA